LLFLIANKTLLVIPFGFSGEAGIIELVGPNERPSLLIRRPGGVSRTAKQGDLHNDGGNIPPAPCKLCMKQISHEHIETGKRRRIVQINSFVVLEGV
jgi:hypothetical protein